MSAAAKLQTWTTTQEEEDRMVPGHMHHWRTMIDHVCERDLRHKTVLDYGCNQGGFIQMLFNTMPFQRAVGVDIAQGSLEKARQRNQFAPADFHHVDELAAMDATFDLAFSHEVIYLLPDLNAHAKQIARALKPGGVYYAATGCHTDNPHWADWHTAISDYSNIAVPHYALDDYAAAFAANGFAVEAKQFRSNDFIAVEPDDKTYYPRLVDKLNYYSQTKILFRFVRVK